MDSSNFAHGLAMRNADGPQGTDDLAQSLRYARYMNATGTGDLISLRGGRLGSKVLWHQGHPDDYCETIDNIEYRYRWTGDPLVKQTPNGPAFMYDWVQPG